jgi:hypothetical protein
MLLSPELRKNEGNQGTQKHPAIAWAIFWPNLLNLLKGDPNVKKGQASEKAE